MQKITPYLWFNRNAEEAMNYYVSVFKDSRIVNIVRYPQNQQVGPEANMGGQILNGTFELFGQQFYCIDGGPYFKFNEAISLFVACKDQEEIDYLWEKLSAVPEAEQCGWCKDKFGVSWQIVPDNMENIMNDPVKGPKSMQNVLSMKKIVIADLDN